MSTPRPKRAALKRRLTELSVRKLKPKSDAYVVWDTYQRGLAIRVQPTGARAWKVIYSYHGRPRWLHLGKVDAIGLADARLLAQEHMLEVARGKDPAAEKRAERGAGTFAELAERYVEALRQEENKVLAPGRHAGPPLRPAALGQAAGSLDHPRRRPHPAGQDRPPHSPKPNFGERQRCLLLGHQAGDHRRQPLHAVWNATRPGAVSASCPTRRCRGSGLRSTTPG